MKKEQETSDRKFKFGNSEFESKRVLKIPCKIGDKKVKIRTEIIEGEVPWLIGRETMVNMGLIMDIEKRKVYLRNFNNLEMKCNLDERNHLRLELMKQKISTIWIVKDWIQDNLKCRKGLAKLHLQFGHGSCQKIWNLIENSYKNENFFENNKREIKAELQKICDNCNICKKYKRNPPKPVVGFPMASKFNEMVSLDLGEYEGKRFLVMVDMATNYVRSMWLKNKKPKEIIKKIMKNWISIFGAPEKFFSDNGLEFQNEEFKLLTEVFGTEIKSTPAKSPWSNGKCEKMVGLIKEGVSKLMEEEVSDSDIALSWTVSAKNSLLMKSGFSPNQLVFGRNIRLNNLTGETKIPELNIENTGCEIIEENLAAMRKARIIHIKQESEERIRRALSKNVREHKIEEARIGDKVYYKRENEKRWRGPAKVIGIDGKTVIVKHGGTLREINRVHITRIEQVGEEKFNVESSKENSDSEEMIVRRLCHSKDEEEEEEQANEEENIVEEEGGEEDEENIVEEEGEKEEEDNEEENIEEESEEEEEEENFEDEESEEEDEEEEEETVEKVPLVKKGERWKMINKNTEESIVVKILSRAGKVNSKKWKDSYNIKNLENGEIKWIDLREHKEFKKIPEIEETLLVNCDGEDVLKAKIKELDSWKDNGVYEEVRREGQKIISTRWIVTEKMKEGKNICKARLVARGFEEQKDENLNESPTCSSEVLKMTLAIINKNKWECKTIDVKTAYLQGKEIKRNVYLRPPREAKTKGIWKLKKTVYGLRDAARAWYDSISEILQELGGIKCRLEPTIFYWKKEGKLKGIMCTHVDDFCYGGDNEFQEEIIKQLKEKIKVGSEEIINFKYIGIRVEQMEEDILLDQTHYVKQIDCPERSRFMKDKELEDNELTEYRAMVGRLNWLSQHTRPDMAVEVSLLSKKFKGAKTSDMRNLIKVTKKMMEKEVKIAINQLKGNSLKLEVYADASFNNVGDGNSQIGYVICMRDESGNKCPLLWKSKIAKRVAKSTIEAEALSVGEAAENAIYLKNIWEEINNDDYVIIDIKTDSKTLERSIKSANGVLSRRLRIDIAAIREMIERKEISSIEWIGTKDQLADALTKKGVKDNEILKYVTERNKENEREKKMI